MLKVITTGNIETTIRIDRNNTIHAQRRCLGDSNSYYHIPALYGELHAAQVSSDERSCGWTQYATLAEILPESRRLSALIAGRVAEHAETSRLLAEELESMAPAPARKGAKNV